MLRRALAALASAAVVISGLTIGASAANAAGAGIATLPTISVPTWDAGSSNAVTVGWTNSVDTITTVMARSPWPWSAGWTTGTVTATGGVTTGTVAQTIICTQSGVDIVFSISSASMASQPTCNYSNAAYWKGVWLTGGTLSVASTATISVAFPVGQIIAPNSSRTDTWLLGQYDSNPISAQVEVAMTSVLDPNAPLITINIDGNGGTCSKTQVTGFQNSWAVAPSNCQKPGQWLFRGYNTSADGSGLAIAPGGNLHLTGDNTLYAIYYAPRAPGVPTDVVAVGGRNAVTVTWKPPADLGEPAGASYIATAKPSGARCSVSRDTQPNGDGKLGCTISVPASGSLVDVSVVADNFFASSSASVPSNKVKTFDLVLETVERPKANLIDRLFKGQGSTIGFTGRAPGLAGEKVTPQIKIGSGDWASESDSRVTVDENGEVSWSKVLSKKLDKQPVEVRFAYRSEASNAYAASIGQTVGLPSAPREVKLKAGLGEYTVSWKAPANDGGSPVTSYVVKSNLKRFACTVKVPATSCDIGLGSSSATGPVDFTVSAVSARGQGKAAKGNGTVVYRWIQPISVTTYPVGDRETEVNILFYSEGLQEKQVTVELRIGKDGAWKKKGNPEPVSRPNRMYWSGVLGSEAQNQAIYLRASTPFGTSRVRQIR